MGNEYRLTTRWVLEAPIRAVWNAISDPLLWPSWWPYVANVELLAPGDAAGVGAVHRYTWRSALPYQLTFVVNVVRCEAPHLLEGRAAGELQGVGSWRLESAGERTSVRYDWFVSTTRAWMNLLAPIARPIFEWNHGKVMRAGGEGLARYLGVRLLEAVAIR